MSEETNDNIVVLNDEEGKEVPFEFLDVVDYEDNEYVVLTPIDAGDDEGTVVILQLETSGEDDEEDVESYVAVEDEAVLNAVFDIFKDRISTNLKTDRKNSRAAGVFNFTADPEQILRGFNSVSSRSPTRCSTP